MAATFTVTQIERKHQLGDIRAINATIVAAGTYTATGDSLDLGTLLGLNRVDVVIFESIASVPGSSGTAGADPAYDYTNKKLKFYGGAASGALQAELTAATSVAGFQVKCLVLGA
jgi:hypothetical protein